MRSSGVAVLPRPIAHDETFGKLGPPPLLWQQPAWPLQHKPAANSVAHRVLPETYLNHYCLCLLLWFGSWSKQNSAQPWLLLKSLGCSSSGIPKNPAFQRNLIFGGHTFWLPCQFVGGSNHNEYIFSTWAPSLLKSLGGFRNTGTESKCLERALWKLGALRKCN